MSVKRKQKADVGGRLSSYQKMKQKYEARINQLTDDIVALVDETDLEKTIIVKTKWRLHLDVEKAIWTGTTRTEG